MEEAAKKEAAAEAAEAAAAATAEELKGIPAATATWPEVEGFMAVVEGTIEVGSYGLKFKEGCKPNSARHRHIVQMARQWQAGNAQHQKRRIHKFIIDLQQAMTSN